MKSATLVPESLLVRTQSPEVLRGLWYDVRSQHHDDSTHFLLPYAYVKVNLRILLRFLRLRSIIYLCVIVVLQRFSRVFL